MLKLHRSTLLLLLLASTAAPYSFAEGQAPAPAPAAAPSGEHKDVPMVSDAAEQKIIERMMETNAFRLKGWPGMVFYCPAENSSVAALKQICQDSYKLLETLSAQHNVKFHKARNANDAALLPHLTGRAKVLIELTATDASAKPAAIAAHISVYAHYAHAVNRASELPQTQEGSQPKHPTLVPQHVDATLWEASVIKASDGGLDSLAAPVTQAVSDSLNTFFADYDKANKLP